MCAIHTRGSFETHLIRSGQEEYVTVNRVCYRVTITSSQLLMKTKWRISFQKYGAICDMTKKTMTLLQGWFGHFKEWFYALFRRIFLWVYVMLKVSVNNPRTIGHFKTKNKNVIREIPNQMCENVKINNKLGLTECAVFNKVIAYI